MLETMQPLNFESVVRETHASIRAYIAGMGIAAHEVDDIAQDVYLELYRTQNRVPAEVPLIRWLKGIARNLCLNHIRRSSRRGRLHREALVELLARTEYSDALPADEDGLSSALRDCCGKLTERNRQLLKLRYHDDLPSASIAEAIESTAEAVRIALFRIRSQLRDCLARSPAGEHLP